jgi:hypothetical protein
VMGLQSRIDLRSRCTALILDQLPNPVACPCKIHSRLRGDANQIRGTIGKLMSKAKLSCSNNSEVRSRGNLPRTINQILCLRLQKLLSHVNEPGGSEQWDR